MTRTMSTLVVIRGNSGSGKTTVSNGRLDATCSLEAIVNRICNDIRVS
ncbi:hypothetical protein ACWCW7_10040 [Nocardia tengchongensis]